jgi:hypothetical protein
MPDGTGPRPAPFPVSRASHPHSSVRWPIAQEVGDIAATDMFTSFLFEPSFGAVDLARDGS